MGKLFLRSMVAAVSLYVVLRIMAAVILPVIELFRMLPNVQ